MENLQETMTAWLRSGQTAEGQLEIATYGNNLLMAQMTGTDFRLHIAASNTKWGGTPDKWGFRPTRCPPP